MAARLDTVRLKSGPIVDRECYTDPAVYDAEFATIFEHCWLYVAHVSEFARPGDFRTTEIAGQPVIAMMDDGGEIGVFYNSCRHRGAIVEEAERGSRRRFRCLYHHWEYGCDGSLLHVPRKDGFGPHFRQETHGLVRLPRVEIFNGLIFANLDPNAASFTDYLGEAEPYLAEIALYAGRPMKVLGSFEYAYDGNWKLLYENSLDDYHAEHLHALAYATQPNFRYGEDYSGQETEEEASVPVPHGTAANRSCAAVGRHSLLEWYDPPHKMPYQQERNHRVNIGIFPAFLGVFHPVMNITGLRVIKPERVDRTRVLNVCLAPVDEPDEVHQATAARFQEAWGPGGAIMMEDIRCLNLVQRGLRAKRAGDVLVTRGMARRGSRGSVADEHSIRGFWDTWRGYMGA